MNEISKTVYIRFLEGMMSLMANQIASENEPPEEEEGDVWVNIASFREALDAWITCIEVGDSENLVFFSRNSNLLRLKMIEVAVDLLCNGGAREVAEKFTAIKTILEDRIHNIKDLDDRVGRCQIHNMLPFEEKKVQILYGLFKRFWDDMVGLMAYRAAFAKSQAAETAISAPSS